ncbi:MAG: Lrp/AsnC ligand binding domain-containing protein [Thermoplasmatota archaeon]
MVGFIFIKTESKKEVKTFRSLKMLKEITELTPLFGEFDLLAKVEARDFNELSVIVLKKIRTIPGVIETRTLPGVKI